MSSSEQFRENFDMSQPIVDAFLVGDDTVSLTSKMRLEVPTGEVPSEKLQVGDILRRTCQLGGSACAANGCQAPEGYVNRIEKLCSDMNLAELIDEIGVPREKLLMVGVTADGVGFYDELKASEAINTNSVGIRELSGYNAFFAKDSEEVVLGARLADCGFVAIEFSAEDGETVRGFVHLTRPNMQGDTELRFVVDDRPAGSFQYFMHEGLNHYGGNIEDVRVRVTAAIKKENFPHTFADEATLEEKFPDWFTDGLMENSSDPSWVPGEGFDTDDVWLPLYRDMVMKQILRSGLLPEQIMTDDMIDPADLELGHASNHAGAHGKMPDARDAYLVGPSRLLLTRH